MKKLFFLLILSLAFSSKAQTCTALYSYGANFETVHFFNQSVVANAHYYWNFGDGTGSNFKEPIHEFPENGTYLVTLYANDTISNCSGYYEQWINIIKNSPDPCTPTISDSIYNISGAFYLKVKDNSINCTNYTPVYKVGAASGPAYNIKGLGYYNGNFIAAVYYTDINGTVERTGVKTCPNNFDRSKNYQTCSANFEFSVISEDATSQRIQFRAMRKNALRYEWLISGFGNPIYGYSDTISIRYFGDPFSQFPNLPHDVILSVREQNGCRDSLWQHVTLRKKAATYVGLKEFNTENIKLEVFPNPAQDKIKFEYDPAKVQLEQLNICNNLGQTLFILKNPQAQQEIDLSNFASGLYFLKVQNSTGQKVFKVLKE